MKLATRKLMKKNLKLLKPPLKISTADWADTFRVLSSEGSSEPGKWRTDSAPYQREILNAIDSGMVEDITLMTSAQIGKTEIILNIVGKQAHLDPCPILLVQPTDNMANTFSKERLAPMIRDTKVLREIIKDVNIKNSGNTISHKMFPGGYLAMTGAGSPANLASRPVRMVLLDEVDRFPVSAGKEGDPVKLAEKRTNNFWNRKKFKVSTPTIKGISRIDKSYETSTMEEWCLPCPSCGEFQPLEWDRIHGVEKVKDLGMGCKFCGTIHRELSWKKQKQLNGKWIALKPENEKHRGFHLNELASPWKTWAEIAREYNEVKDDPELLKVWWNTSLGLPWVENLGEKIEWEKLFNRRENYEADLPDGVLLLTCGVDVQDNRIEAEVVGWGLGKERWGIEYKIFPGSPAENEVWEDLDNYLKKEFSYKDGNRLGIVSTCIDTGGHHTKESYDFISPRQNSRRIFGIKGLGGEYISILNGFRPTKNKEISLLSLGTNALKDVTYGSLRVKEPGERYCHFPKDIEKGYGQEYFEQLTSETKIMKDRKIVWKKNRRNEALDVRNYATAAFELLNANLEEISKVAKEKLINVGKVKKIKKIKRKIHSRGVE